MQQSKEVLIIGGGPGGLTLALELHARKIPFKIVEAATEYKPVGVGLNLLPHAVKKLGRLGVVDALLERGVTPKEYQFYTRSGQLVDSEKRGLSAGYEWPQISIHRADLHDVLLNAVVERAGSDVLNMDHKCIGVDQSDDYAIVHLEQTSTRESLPDAHGAVAIACDGVHSIARVQLHPKEAVPRYEGTIMYRGTTRWKPFLGGTTQVYMGTTEFGKLITYPIRNNIDADGRQLINWVIEIDRPQEALKRDWNKQTSYEEFIEDMAERNFNFLDVPGIIKAAEVILEYPMLDQDPLPSWTDGRITLLGDAAHPMMPRGSNGFAQAALDADVLSELLATESDWKVALKKYENARLDATSKVVLANRSIAPDGILRVVEERTGGARFDDINQVISQQEREDWQRRYKEVIGFTVQDLKQ